MRWGCCGLLQTAVGLLWAVVTCCGLLWGCSESAVGCCEADVRLLCGLLWAAVGVAVDCCEGCCGGLLGRRRGCWA